jgi:hypothetical protein
MRKKIIVGGRGQAFPQDANFQFMLGHGRPPGPNELTTPPGSGKGRPTGGGFLDTVPGNILETPPSNGGELDPKALPPGPMAGP